MILQEGGPIVGSPGESHYEISFDRSDSRKAEVLGLCLKIVGSGKVGGVTVQVQLSTGCKKYIIIYYHIL